MKLNFYKYNSNGNDFIIVDETLNQFDFSKETIQKLCSRQFCIGADGLLLIQKSKKAHFKMKIFNSDGLEANMCGNGLLCSIKFINDHIVKKSTYLIETKSNVYETFVENDLVGFKTCFPKIIKESNEIILKNLKLNFPVIDSGVLHGVIFFDKIENLDVFNLGSEIRYLKCFLPEGINVNFCEKVSDSEIKVRTYERGVENETFCCSTGALAVASVVYRKSKIKSPLNILFKGGTILIDYDDSSLKLMKNPTFAFQGITNIF